MKLKAGQKAILRAISNDRYEYRITCNVVNFDSSRNVRLSYVGTCDAKFEGRELSDSYATRPFDSYKEARAFLFAQAKKDN